MNRIPSSYNRNWTGGPGGFPVQGGGAGLDAFGGLGGFGTGAAGGGFPGLGGGAPVSGPPALFGAAPVQAAAQAAAPAAKGGGLGSLLNAANLESVKGFIDKMGGIEGLISNIGKIQKNYVVRPADRAAHQDFHVQKQKIRGSRRR
ncbi:hypothetical protein OMP38_17405 [Cohnella ginsengisoli]|uniref:Uncharacterized protein n=1 Tax=Cohnella ginsengisoli TaxID=425004 RepID=A0A9X4QN48_9BACL|nr:hypothetical protein [Cohnella ginsengisoli]MDG0792453.1 hypothetical protein [Cohnella ginsengisoli]